MANKWNVILSGVLAAGLFTVGGPVQEVRANVGEKPVRVVSSPTGSSESTTLVLSDQKHVWAWGDAGLTGRGSSYGVDVPYRVRLFEQNGSEVTEGLKDIGTGNEHSAVLTESGTVWTWGENYYGMLGSGNMLNRYTPGQAMTNPGGTGLVPLSGIIDISVGTTHNLALKSDHTVWAWGSNSDGQLGDGTTTQRNEAVQVMLGPTTPLTNVIEIAAGEYFSMALTADGKVYTWGDNYFGKLGAGIYNYSAYSAVPIQIAGPGVDSKVVQHIYTNSSSSSAFYQTADDSIYGWGGNTSGQLGNGDFIDYAHGEQGVFVPEEITALKNKGVVDISAGQQHTLVQTASGQVYGMGTDSDGQLLHFSPTYNEAVYKVYTPVELSPGIAGVTAIGAGSYSSFLIQSSGFMLGFGSNRYLQLGLGDGKLPILDTNADNLDDRTGDSYTDSNNDGYSDQYPIRLITIYPLPSLYEQGVTVSGKVVLKGTNVPLKRMAVSLYSSTHGTLSTTTDDSGNFTFTSILSGAHTLSQEDSYYYSNDSIDLNVTNAISGVSLELEAYWAPKNMTFTDTNPTAGVISGTIGWVNSTYPLTDPKVLIYFADASGNPLSLAAESTGYAPSYTITNVNVPANAENLKMYVQSMYPSSPVCTAACDTGMIIPLVDVSDTLGNAVDELYFSDLDLKLGFIKGTVRWVPLANSTGIDHYAIYWADSNGNKLGSALGSYAAGGGNRAVLQQTAIPAGATDLAVFSLDSAGAVLGKTTIYVADTGPVEAAGLLAKAKMATGTTSAWTIRQVLTFMSGNPVDLTNDGVVDSQDLELLVNLVEPRNANMVQQ